MKYAGIIIVLIIILAGGYTLLRGEDTIPSGDVDVDIEIPKEEITLTDGTYTIDTKTSSITWTGRKSRVLGYEDSGTVALSDGFVEIADSALQGGRFTVDLTTIAATNVSNSLPPERLSEHLKSDAFFDVAMYPDAQFVVTAVVGGVVTGELTIKDTTNAISFLVTVRQEEETLIAEGEVLFNRADFDIRFGSGTFFDDLGDNLIDDMVSLGFELHTVPAEAS